MVEEKINPKWSKPTTEVLKNRMDSLISLFSKVKDYPYSARVLGFPLLCIKSEEDLKSRIRELADILNVTVHEVAKLPNGSTVWKRI